MRAPPRPNGARAGRCHAASTHNGRSPACFEVSSSALGGPTSVSIQDAQVQEDGLREGASAARHRQRRLHIRIGGSFRVLVVFLDVRS